MVLEVYYWHIAGILMLAASYEVGKCIPCFLCFISSKPLLYQVPLKHVSPSKSTQKTISGSYLYII